MVETMIGVIFVLACSVAGTKLDDRIVGGENARLGEIPYIVSVRGQDRHGCGGAILNEKFVITAAHCVHGWDSRPDLFSVQYGIIRISQKEPNVLPVKKITIHEDYVHGGAYPNDIALLEIDGEFNFNENAQPVKLPSSPFEDPGDNVDALLAGWGLQNSGGQIQEDLKKVTLIKFNDEYCSIAVSKYDSDLHICAGVYGGGKGQCTADSGGPLTIEGKQFGIVSWSKKPCASNGNPGVFTKVTHHRDWIRKNTGV